MTLREALARPPQPGALVRCPIAALVAGEPVTVTAVLERTAVYERPGTRAGERQLARLDLLTPTEPLRWVAPDPSSQREAAKRGRRVALRSKQARVRNGAFARPG